MVAAGWTLERLLAGVRGGDRRALARAITLVESGDPLSGPLLAELYPETGRAVTIGVTGPPGSGKSTLIGALIRHVRALELTVGVVSVDPASPFTQGALLGDRIRMSDHFLDDGVYIRSMSTRGHLGGLSLAASHAVALVDAAGRDVIFVETVGVGQNDVKVANVVDVVLLVLVPGSGDSVQALKAGVMEIPDVIVVNKLDHPAADAMLADVRSAVSLDPDAEQRPAVLGTEAVVGAGVPELWEAVQHCRARLAQSGRLDERRRRHAHDEVVSLAMASMQAELHDRIRRDESMRKLIAEVAERSLDPLTAATELAKGVRGGGTADAR